MSLQARITHTWDIADEDKTLVHIQATKETAKLSAPSGEVYMTNVELRELARAANAAARV